MEIQAFIDTKPARKHVDGDENYSQDRYYVDPSRRFFIVADGLGDFGRERSEEAVGNMASGLDELLSNPASVQDVEASLRSLIGRIDSALCEENIKYLTENPTKQHKYTREEVGGTTLEVLVYLENQQKFVLAHVGDSKTIGITQNGDYVELSIEQSPWKSQAIEDGLTEEQQLTHGSRNRLDCFIGDTEVIKNEEDDSLRIVNGKLEIQTSVFPANKYSYLLMATDGVFDYATQREIMQIITSELLDTTAQRLVERAHNPQEVLEFYCRQYKDQHTREEIQEELTARDDATAIVIKPELVKKTVSEQPNPAKIGSYGRAKTFREQESYLEAIEEYRLIIGHEVGGGITDAMLFVLSVNGLCWSSCKTDSLDGIRHAREACDGLIQKKGLILEQESLACMYHNLSGTYGVEARILMEKGLKKEARDHYTVAIRYAEQALETCPDGLQSKACHNEIRKMQTRLDELARC